MDETAIVGLAAAGAAVAVAGIVWYLRRGVSPEELERRRRFAVNAGGRMVDATVVGVDEGIVQYRYEVRGVTYTAAQDLKGLSGAPEDPALLLGVATVKYLPRDPASSIVYCETWSGLRPGTSAVPEIDSIQKES